jgi:hypothetical protein
MRCEYPYTVYSPPNQPSAVTSPAAQGLKKTANATQDLKQNKNRNDFTPNAWPRCVVYRPRKQKKLPDESGPKTTTFDRKVGSDRLENC